MPEQGPFNTRVFSEDYDFTAHTDARGVSGLALAPELSADFTAGLGILVENGTSQSLTVIVPEALEHEMPRPHGGLTVEHDSATGESYYTAGGTDDRYMNVIRERRASLMQKIILQGPAGTSEYAPTVSSAAAIKRIKEQDPQAILFLGGAGMSAEQIWTFEMLGERAGYDIKSAERADTDHNNTYVRDFIANPVVATRTMGLFDTLAEQKARATPTGAHYAFSEIMRTLGDRPMAITSNYDKLYDRAGLRVPRIGLTWPETRTSTWEDDPEIAREFERRARSISLIVAIGVGGDYKNIIQHVRQENADVTVLGVNPASPLDLRYMRSSDMLLQDDAQRAMPLMAEALAA